VKSKNHKSTSLRKCNRKMRENPDSKEWNVCKLKKKLTKEKKLLTQTTFEVQAINQQMGCTTWPS